ncbi:hypothetical protein IMY05_002G0214300 [Salix suchowensis]|nr:hypothetical protein IMY05_002G0214300 [Salix suchowensis]
MSGWLAGCFFYIYMYIYVCVCVCVCVCVIRELKESDSISEKSRKRLVLPRQSPPAYPERFSRFQYSNTVLFKTQMVKCPSSLHDLILFPLHQVAAAFY